MSNHGPNPHVWHTMMMRRLLYASNPNEFGALLRNMPRDARARAAVVVVDIERATTTGVAVLAAGARELTYQSKPAAAYGVGVVHAAPYAADWVFGGETNGRPIDGCIISNAPEDVLAQRENLQGKSVLFYSTNGAAAFEAAATAGFADVYMMCCANIDVTVQSLIGGGYSQVYFVGGGFYGRTAFEDTAAVGRACSMILELHDWPCRMLDDGARVAVFTARANTNDCELQARAESAQVAQLLGEMDRHRDVAACIRGDGIEDLWPLMANTVAKVHWRNKTPVLRIS